MRKLLIQEKLVELGVDLNSISLGDFDYIGEFTAKKRRDQNTELWNKRGAFFRPNYERGILVYHLIKQNNLKSMLEIGFGRGYSTICAAKAFSELGRTDVCVTTVDAAFSEEHIKMLSNIFPQEWLSLIRLISGKSEQVGGHLESSYDLIYIDGDHTEQGTRIDWELTKDRWNHSVLFDDYHLQQQDKNIECAKVIDTINEDDYNAKEKELIITDRRMFLDDRLLPDDQVSYGMCLMTKKQTATKVENLFDW
jgi:hypothetical protein